MFLFCLVLAMFCARLFICVLWSPAGKGLTSWLSFVVSTVSLSLSLGILGQVWYLIVSIPDRCTLTYLVHKSMNVTVCIHQGLLNHFKITCPRTLLYDD